MESRSRGSNQDDPTLLSGSSASEEQTFLTDSNEPTYLSPLSLPASAAGDGPRLEDGQTFGPYEIIRLLGRGGMGEVYEARQLETGRRVALKVLRSRFGLREDRERFLREGQLAASISHPHTVYIFGSEEIDRMPVISMQLLPGGTLKDRVVERGPMSPTEAVASVLDVIGGLDAAESAGILHRDIKPSNCFVDVDGSVKVGDFGLSISTSAREATQGTSGFQGTPQFAPPEQLRGEALDVRADIYAVGATLFYLLTGKPPFESRDINDLFESVKNAPAMAPQQLQPKIPSALGAVVLRCLAKEPAKRPASYAELVRALRPFSGSSTPARRGLRVVAGVIDAFIAATPILVMKMFTGGVVKDTRPGSRTTVDVDPWAFTFAVLYYAICEWRWGATIGKRICGLRVVSTSGELSWKQALSRSLLFYSPAIPLLVSVLLFGQVAVETFMSRHGALGVLTGTGQVIVSTLFFATMRRKNGLAAVHDLLTGTRVVVQRHTELRRATADTRTVVDVASEHQSATGRLRYGPFDVGAELIQIPGGRLLEGFDAVLKRRVWLAECMAGAPPVASQRRDIDRVGRPHWLAGRRSSGDAAENWDAFEAPQGAPLDPAPASAPWTSTRGWLADLASELAAAERDGTTPHLSLDRLWIRHDGRAVLLDFPAPGAASASPTSPMTPLELLAAVGKTSLGHKDAMPMPVSAVAMIDRWSRGSTKSIAAAQDDLVAVSISPDRVSRSRRLTPVALNAFPVVAMLVSAAIAIGTVGKILSRDYYVVVELLSNLETEKDPVKLHAIETYLAANYHKQLLDQTAWNLTRDDKKGGGVRSQRFRTVAQRLAAQQPGAEDAVASAAIVQPSITELNRRYDQEFTKKGWTGPETILVVLLLIGGGFSFFCGLVSVLLRPSGVTMSMLGLAVLNRKGREISRFGAVLRLVVAWSPLVVYGALLCVPQLRTPLRSGVLGIALPIVVTLLLLAGVIWTIVRPTRGPHDAVMGTVVGVR